MWRIIGLLCMWLTMMGGPAWAQSVTTTLVNANVNPSAVNGTVTITAQVVPQITYDLRFPLGFGANPGTGIFLRYDFANATAAVPITTAMLSNFTNPAAFGGSVVAQGGQVGDNFVVFQVTIAAAALPTDVARLNLPFGGVTFASGTTPTVFFSLHGDPVSAATPGGMGAGRISSSGPTSFSSFASGTAPTGTIQFQSNSVTISGCNAVTMVSSSASCTTAFSPANSYTITANYGGDPANQASSGMYTQIVSAALTAPTVTVTSSANPANFPQAFTLTASVAGISPAGVVTFSDATTNPATVICSNVQLIAGASGQPSTATCAVPQANRAIGTHQYRAAYGGDANNSAGFGNLTQSVLGVATTTTLSSAPIKPVAGMNVTLTALVTGSNPTGNVFFSDGGVPLAGCNGVVLQTLPGSATGSGVATCVITSIATGVRNITAVYGGNSGNQGSNGTLSLTVPPSGPLDYTDMWWAGSVENGWGMAIMQHGPVQFTAFYVYDNAGKPVWYVMPGGSWNVFNTSFSGSLYQPTGAPFGNYNASQFVVGSPVGTATVQFLNNTTATVSYTINGISAQKSIMRQPFGSPDSNPTLVVGDMWWGGSLDPTQNGWGISVAQQVRQLFAVWFTYDANGKTTWFVIPGGTWTGTSFTGSLFSTTGSPWLGTTYNPNALTVTNVGTMTFNFTDAGTGSMTYNFTAGPYAGVSQTKPITRQPY